ncbi:hypothetical protein ScalyP_jg11816, partial [Parmales sp. scaly parma]
MKFLQATILLASASLAQAQEICRVLDAFDTENAVSASCCTAINTAGGSVAGGGAVTSHATSDTCQSECGTATMYALATGEAASVLAAGTQDDFVAACVAGDWMVDTCRVLDAFDTTTEVGGTCCAAINTAGGSVA